MSAYLEPLQRGISCLTRAQIQAQRPPRGLTAQSSAVGAFPITLADGAPVPLATLSSAPRYAFSLAQRYTLLYAPEERNRDPWSVRIAAYAYALHDHEGREL